MGCEVSVFELEDMTRHRLLSQCADTMSYSMF